jgi:hypothetical protein
VAQARLADGTPAGRSLARTSGLDEDRIWEWGFIEVVANGLSHLEQGNIVSGRPFLDVASSSTATATNKPGSCGPPSPNGSGRLRQQEQDDNVTKQAAR